MPASETQRPLVLVLPLPPSINHYWRHRVIPVRGHRGKYRAQVYRSVEGDAYIETIKAIIAAIDPPLEPLDGKLRADIFLWYRDAREDWNLDNRVKPLLDALAYAGVYEDDKQIRCHKATDRGVMRPNGQAIVKLRPLERMLF